MRRLYAISLMCILLGYGCAPSMEPQRRFIALNASLEEVRIDGTIESKAGGSVSADPYTGSPAVSNSLDAALWFSYDLGSYSHNPASPQNLPCATSVSYDSHAPVDIRQDGQLVLYPVPVDANYAEVGDEVYCVGFSPSTGWGELTASAVSSAGHAINGSEDLMFADQMIGSYSENFGSQTYRHLLTWIRINMSTTSLKAAAIWGDVESLEIVSPNRTLTVDFSNSLQDGVPQASTVGYSGGPDDFHLALPANSSLSVTTKLFGQVFCAPPAPAVLNGSGKYEYLTGDSGELGYIIRVRTKNIPQKEVFVKLKKEDNVTLIESADYAIGKLFVVNLHFNEIAVVEGVCTLRQWDDQNSDIYLK